MMAAISTRLVHSSQPYRSRLCAGLYSGSAMWFRHMPASASVLTMMMPLAAERPPM